MQKGKGRQTQKGNGKGRNGKRSSFKKRWLILILLLVGFVFWAKQPGHLSSLKSSFYRFRWSRQSGEEVPYNGRAMLVVDRQSGQVIASKKKGKECLPASLAKLFTVEYVSERVDLDKKITVSKAALGQLKEGASSAQLRPGESYKVKDLFAAMLVPSGGDAAYVLADYVGGKQHPEAKTSSERIQLYLEDLNAFIQEKGWHATKINDPSGYDLKGTTSAEDLRGVCDLLLEKAWFRDIVSKRKYTVPIPHGHTKSWKNTNAFLDPDSPYYDSRVKGVKTGSLDEKYNLIVLYQQGKKEFLLISLGSHSDEARYDDAAQLIQYWIKGEH